MTKFTAKKDRKNCCAYHICDFFIFFTELQCVETLHFILSIKFWWFANDFLFCIKFSCQKSSFPAKTTILRSKEIKPFQFHEKIPGLEYGFDGEYIAAACQIRQALTLQKSSNRTFSTEKNFELYSIMWICLQSFYSRLRLVVKGGFKNIKF